VNKFVYLGNSDSVCCMALERRREGKRNRKHLAQCAKIRNPNPLEMLAGYSVVVWVGLLILLSTLEQGFSVTKH
jgi:hypothetical protein